MTEWWLNLRILKITLRIISGDQSLNIWLFLNAEQFLWIALIAVFVFVGLYSTPDLHFNCSLAPDRPVSAPCSKDWILRPVWELLFEGYSPYLRPILDSQCCAVVFVRSLFESWASRRVFFFGSYLDQKCPRNNSHQFSWNNCLPWSHNFEGQLVLLAGEAFRGVREICMSSQTCLTRNPRALTSRNSAWISTFRRGACPV